MNMTKKIATLGSLSLGTVSELFADSGSRCIRTAARPAEPRRAAPAKLRTRACSSGPITSRTPTKSCLTRCSSLPKSRKDKKAPLIVALHGVFGDGNSLLRGNALDLAEEGGYILVGPMGYNPQGWFGSPVIVMNGGPGKGKGKGPGAGKGGPPPTPEPPNLAELSEKDVMNVLAIVRKEFTVDDKRTYLMGHSMGGAGALFLGPKYVDQWAAVAVHGSSCVPYAAGELGAR